MLGQGPDVLGGALTYRTPATQASDAGRYPLTASGLTSGNYAISYAPGALDIDAGAAPVTPFGSRTYGAAEAEYDPQFTGFVLGQGPDVLDGALTYRTPATRGERRRPLPAHSRRPDQRQLRDHLRPGRRSTSSARRCRSSPTTRAGPRARPTRPSRPATRASCSARTRTRWTARSTIDTPATHVEPAGRLRADPRRADQRQLRHRLRRRRADRDRRAARSRAGPGTRARPGPADPGGAASVTGGAFLERFGRGAPPLTPGDASFRTTQAEAPPAIDAPFALTYSLGEIVQLAPAGAQTADAGFAPASGGFNPASGGSDAADGAPAGACSGPVNRGADADCARRTARESFWTTTADDRP